MNSSAKEIMITSREKILNEVRKATAIPSQLPTSPDNIDQRIAKSLASITPKGNEALREQFKKELELVSGEFHLVRDQEEAAALVSIITSQSGYKKLAVSGEELCQDIARRVNEKNLDIQLIYATKIEHPKRKHELASIPASLVEASFAIADTGSLVFLYDESRTSLPHFLSDCIFVVIKQQQIIANQFDLFNKLSVEKAKNMVFVTGPSRTADIEKVLTLGAHGPRRLIVMMLEMGVKSSNLT